MNPKINLIQRAGRLLYGEHWQSHLAQDVGCSERIFRRWISGDAPLPNGVFHDVFLQIQTHAGELSMLRDEMQTLLSGKPLPRKTAKELEQLVIENASASIAMPRGMTVTVLAKGETWEALPNSHSVIAYVDQCREISKAASRLRQQYSLSEGGAKTEIAKKESAKHFAAIGRAFERGQQDFRDGKNDNPYPFESPWHAPWEQGYEDEREIHHK
jgi:hypothetical protein